MQYANALLVKLKKRKAIMFEPKRMDDYKDKSPP